MHRSPTAPSLPDDADPTKRLSRSVLRDAVDLYVQAPTHDRSEIRAFGDLVDGLLADAGFTERRHVAAVLARRGDVPPELARRLAMDTADIAAPMIVGSPVLTSSDLVQILRCSADHVRLVAARLELSPDIASILIDSNHLPSGLRRTAAPHHLPPATAEVKATAEIEPKREAPVAAPKREAAAAKVETATPEAVAAIMTKLEALMAVSAALRAAPFEAPKAKAPVVETPAVATPKKDAPVMRAPLPEAPIPVAAVTAAAPTTAPLASATPAPVERAPEAARAKVDRLAATLNSVLQDAVSAVMSEAEAARRLDTSVRRTAEAPTAANSHGPAREAAATATAAPGPAEAGESTPLFRVPMRGDAQPSTATAPRERGGDTSFLDLDPAGRWRALQEAAAEVVVQPPLRRKPGVDLAALGERMFVAAAERDVTGLTRELAEALDLEPAIAARVVGDPSGEPLAVALAAAGIDERTATSILLLLGGEAVTLAHMQDLQAMAGRTGRRTAEHLVAKWRIERAGRKVEPRRAVDTSERREVPAPKAAERASPEALREAMDMIARHRQNEGR